MIFQGLTERYETMRSLEELLIENNLRDPEDIDALVELAEITGRLISDESCSDIERLIQYLVSNDCYEAFSWVLAALQEEFDKEENYTLKDFTCYIGRSIADYQNTCCFRAVGWRITQTISRRSLSSGEITLCMQPSALQRR